MLCAEAKLTWATQAMSQSIYFSLISVSSVLLILCIYRSSLFSFLDEKEVIRRVSGLDGLRYFLAIFVVLHHVDCFHNFFINGKWGPSQYYLWAMGKYGVALFFMTTAFLFWGKVRSKDNIDWASLYKGRFLRIVPMAIFASLLAVVSITMYSKGMEGFYFNFRNVIPWLDASLFDFKPAFTNFKTPQVAMAGVTWSLKWEWMFYFLLPLLFVFRKRGFEFAIVLSAISFYIYPLISLKDAYIWSYFAFGILSKEISERLVISKMIANIMFIVSLSLLLFVEPGLFSVTGTPLLALMFLSVVSGANLFGLLTSTSARRLGTISYSIYIMQGVILFPLFAAMHHYNMMNFTFASAIISVSFITFLCVACSATYVFIERRFMHGISFGTLRTQNQKAPQ